MRWRMARRMTRWRKSTNLLRSLLLLLGGLGVGRGLEQLEDLDVSQGLLRLVQRLVKRQAWGEVQEERRREEEERRRGEKERRRGAKERKGKVGDEEEREPVILWGPLGISNTVNLYWATCAPDGGGQNNSLKQILNQKLNKS